MKFLSLNTLAETINTLEILTSELSNTVKDILKDLNANSKAVNIVENMQDKLRKTVKSIHRCVEKLEKRSQLSYVSGIVLGKHPAISLL